MVSGEIVNADGEPLQGVSVLLTNDEEISYGSEYTNRKGTFRIQLIGGIQDTLSTLTFSLKPLEYYQLADTNFTVSLDPVLILKHSISPDAIHFKIVFHE